MKIIAFVFSGQGAQYINMGHSLYERYETARQVFKQADAALGFSISHIMWNDEQALNTTENTQPAILTMSIALERLFIERGIKPDYLAGLSLGEYSAYVASGALDFETAVRLVHKRGKLMEEAVPNGIGAMYAIIGLSREKITEIIKETEHIGYVTIANYNSPVQTVIAGETAAVTAAAEQAKSRGAKMAVKLNVSAPFHTKLLHPAAVKLAEELKNIQFGNTSIPIALNLTGEIAAPDTDHRDNLAKQVENAVRWEDCVRTLIDRGVDTFVELGPGKVLSSFIRQIDKSVRVYNAEDDVTLEKVFANIGTG